MFQRGQVVYSAAGHDKGSRLVILGTEPGGCCLVADGRRRKLASPKRKNPKHLRPTAAAVDLDSAGTDRALRRALQALEAAGPVEE